jgi:hypothetical protein
MNYINVWHLVVIELLTIHFLSIKKITPWSYSEIDPSASFAEGIANG